MRKMSITESMGEWSEVYVFLRLLADGKLFSADKDVNRIENIYFPIIKIIRQEIANMPYEYRPNQPDSMIMIYLGAKQVMCLPVAIFQSEAARLLAEINTGTGSFEVPKTEEFIRSIHMTKLKAPSMNKSDINIHIHYINTGFEHIAGFSIKSELGNPPTLLNAGQTTNFIYKVEGLGFKHIKEINSIDTHTKLKDRMKFMSDLGGKLIYKHLENKVFNNNLIMIDSQMPVIVAELLVGFYSGVSSNCLRLVDYVCDRNPLSRNRKFYQHKIKEMLCSIALGMKPATEWDGTDEASGGYIIVKTNGDVLAYHIYNRDAFKEYLLNNTVLDKPSSSRHGYGVLYEHDGEIYIKLNLQIRFM